MSKTHDPSCRCEGVGCTHIKTCRNKPTGRENDGTYHCFVIPRPPLTGRSARVAYGDGAHCGNGLEDQPRNKRG